MTRLLIRLFIHDYNNTQDASVRSAYGVFAGIVGISTNMLLSCAKIIIGALSGSIAILADGVNNLTDAGASIVTLVGFRLARKPRDKEHPFGHARYEYIAGLVISIVIILFGAQLMQSSIEKIIRPEIPEYNQMIALALLIAILMKVWQYLFYRHVSQKIKSATVKAAAVDSRNDAITTAAVAVSLQLGHQMGWTLADGIMGCMIGLFILISGIMLVKETVSPLLGIAPDAEIIGRLEKRLLSYRGVLGIHDLVVHEYGQSQLFATVHAEVSCEESLLSSHDMIDNIEREISQEMGIHLVIHLDPINTTDEKTLDLKGRVQTMLHEIDESLSFHDFRVVEGFTHTNIIFDVLAPTEFKLSEEDLKQMLSRKIKELSDSEVYYAVIEIDRMYV